MDKGQLLRRAERELGQGFFRPLVEELFTERAADERHARMAHWATLVANGPVQPRTVPVRASWQGCLLGDECTRAQVCLWALRRARAIDEAKYAVARARGQVVTEYPRQ